MMHKQEMIDFIESCVAKGFNRKEAIRSLAILLGEEDPIGFEESWFQQKISGC